MMKRLFKLPVFFMFTTDCPDILFGFDCDYIYNEKQTAFGIAIILFCREYSITIITRGVDEYVKWMKAVFL